MNWSDVFKVADQAIKALATEDQDYLKHLKKAIKEKVKAVDMSDFAFEIVNKDTKKSVKLWNDLYKKKKKEWKPKDLEHFGNLEIYLRKWISEAFAGSRIKVLMLTNLAQYFSTFIANLKKSFDSSMQHNTGARFMAT